MEYLFASASTESITNYLLPNASFYNRLTNNRSNEITDYRQPTNKLDIIFSPSAGLQIWVLYKERIIKNKNTNPVTKIVEYKTKTSWSTTFRRVLNYTAKYFYIGD